MKYFFVICFTFVAFTSSLSFAEEEQKSSPAVYKAMDSISLPYVAQCLADPAVVQEYLLVMEIEYLTWLKMENMSTKQKKVDEWVKLIPKLLIGKIAELEKLQSSCIGSFE